MATEKKLTNDLIVNADKAISFKNLSADNMKKTTYDMSKDEFMSRVQSAIEVCQEHCSNIDESILQKKLIKGMQSAKKGEVYTLEEAWKEIDMVHL